MRLDGARRAQVADLAPIDNDSHCLAVTVYHHEAEGRREGAFSKGSVRESGILSLFKPHRQHAAIWARLLHSDIDAVAQRLLKYSSIFGSLLVSVSVWASAVLYLLTMTF